METSKAIAIQDIQPHAPFHALIIPKKHIASLNDMSADDRREIMPELYELADRLAREKNISDRGYRTIINNQADACQTVFHLHMHMLGGAKLRSQMGI